MVRKPERQRPRPLTEEERVAARRAAAARFEARQARRRNVTVVGADEPRVARWDVSGIPRVHGPSDDEVSHVRS